MSAPEKPTTIDAMAAVEAFRNERLEEARACGAVEARLHTRSNWLGALRLLLFAVASIFIVQAIRTTPELLGRGAAPTAVLFGVVVWIHRRIRQREELAARQRRLALESAARLQGATGPGASTWLPPHPVSLLDAGRAGTAPEGEFHQLDAWILEDLGIEAGPPSLLDLLNTTQTSLGARRLRILLRTPLLDPDAIRRRQSAVGELAEQRPLRDALMLAFHSGRGRDLRRLPAFLAGSAALPGTPYRIALGVCGVVVTPALLLGLRLPHLLPLAGVAFLALLLLALRMRHERGRLRDAYLELEPVLRVVVQLARVLEPYDLRSDLLRSHKERLRQVMDPHAPQRLSRLLRLMQLLHLHEIGFLYGIIDFLTQWDLQWLLALESRTRRERGRIERVVELACELEALVALAVFYDEQPGVRFPELLGAARPEIEIVAGEHLLLHHGEAVPNPLHLGQSQRLGVVTGSNMAGKSTFLRMVALNTLVAQVGAPVRAAAMRLTPVRMHANINVRDSLADGKSYFLVEVERVRSILRAADQHANVLGIFDELFRGTNSVERLAASRAIARHLAARPGLFLLATHELELTRLVYDERVEGITAMHFRDEIEAGRMVFPYRVHAGVGTAHNAIRLLEIAGYPTDVVDGAREEAEDRRPAGS
ncbi:MAG: hypothetical protein JSW67_05475 [Candidatus Latescibacterota bacterium]|nr:MAG: hypothetical protein JSW67_05475 [Candidatus Latescibacterota bacterium]